MRQIDFLSDYPRIYIFEKEENKTNFGGVLFLFFSIIMLIISLSYILDYALNEKYEIQFLSIKNQTLTRDLPLLDADPVYNPALDFKILVRQPFYDNYRIVLCENNENKIFKLSEYYEYQGIIKNGIKINSKVSNFDLTLVYFCGNDSTCKINEEEEFITENSSFIFEFETSFSKIDHQNSSKPILDDTKLYGTKGYLSTFKSHVNIDLFWRVIMYKEKKGISRLFDKLLDRKNEYFTGYYKSEKYSEDESFITTINGNYYRILLGLYIHNDHQEYDQYIRKKITELDVLSTISALFSPVRLIFLFIYGFYSKNFDNYKIIERILSDKNKSKKDIKSNVKF